MTTTVPRLLAISDRRERGGLAWSEWLARLAAAGVDALQVREKELGDRALYELVADLRRAWPRPRRLLVNGRLDVALAAGADGAHLPVDAVPAAALRRRFGAGVVLGVSAHRLDEVDAARDAGADYVTFGPVFPTPSKMRYGAPPGLAGLAQAARRGIPVVALGGLGPDELAAVLAAGAAGVAGIRAFHHPPTLDRWAAAWREARSAPTIGERSGDGTAQPGGDG